MIQSLYQLDPDLLYRIEYSVKWGGGIHAGSVTRGSITEYRAELIRWLYEFIGKGNRVAILSAIPQSGAMRFSETAAGAGKRLRGMEWV